MRREAVGCDMFSIVCEFERRPREAEFGILRFEFRYVSIIASN
jgi:hypothetical protein